MKSITPLVGVTTDCWVEEATECDYKAVKQLFKRLRGRSEVKKRVILSFNPIVKEHWIYKEYFGNWQDDQWSYREDDLLIQKSIYKHNLFLEEDDIKELENEKDPYYRAVYSMGEWGVLGNVIFKNWTVQDLSWLKPTVDRHRYGVDFGFSSDPTAFVDVFYQSSTKTLYILDEFYLTELGNDALADLLRERVGRNYVVCDSAEPRTINELRMKGINAIGAKKGPDSIRFGIEWLRQQNIVIDVTCQNFKNEIQKYKWKEDKFGNPLQVPVDKDNHLIDALRYSTEDIQTERKITSGKRF